MLEKYKKELEQAKMKLSMMNPMKNNRQTHSISATESKIETKSEKRVPKLPPKSDKKQKKIMPKLQ